ncbi:MAG: MFS transporter, partial [Paraburkholderia sp.]
MSDRPSDFTALPAAHRNLPATSLKRARFATMALFFIAGMMYASWGVHVPTVRDRFHLNPALLSFALLAVACGSITAMATNAKWIARVGTRRACLAGGLTMAFCAALILVVPFYWLLLAVLAVFGAGMATLDVAMNAEASAVEQTLGRPIMSALHGMFSVGGMVGAAVGGALLARGMAPAVHLVLAALLSALVLIIACPAVLPHVPHADHPDAGTPRANRWRSPALWALGATALVALIAEGAMYDWGTVYMRDVVLASPALASAAYAAFSGGMAAARFAGDAVRARFGAPQLVMASASLACAGMIGALLLPYSFTTLFGFTLMGLGLANMMPVLFAAAARVEGIHAAEGLAHVAGLAYFGLLLGPVIIGGVTQVTDL